MRYYDDETVYSFDYANVVENTSFDDLIEEDDQHEEWASSYNNVEEEILDD